MPREVKQEIGPVRRFKERSSIELAQFGVVPAGQRLNPDYAIIEAVILRLIDDANLATIERKAG